MEEIREVNAEEDATFSCYLVTVGEEVAVASPLCSVDCETWNADRGCYISLRKEWISPMAGSVKEVYFKAGDLIKKGELILKIEQKCGHSVQLHGLCALCGTDLKTEPERHHATISMLHGASGLTVSEKEAQRLEANTVKRLVQQKKLTLVLDLDQTLIHASIDADIADWMMATHGADEKDEAKIKDIYSFRLPGSPLLYFIKLRPQVRKFLADIKELYELHIYTMGTRAYAMNIASILDPLHDTFKERILSRDDCPDMSFKSLRRLFPFNDSMVAIVDDRADVWQWSRNLLKVSPYQFFIGTGDINSPTAPNTSPIKNDFTSVQSLRSESYPSLESTENFGSKISVDSQFRTDEDGSIFETLIKVLKELHSRYYSLLGDVSPWEMDHIVSSKSLSREADIKLILPEMKRMVLKDVHLLFSGVIPQNQPPEKNEWWILAESFGAVCHLEFDHVVTHVVASNPTTSKVKQALSRRTVFIVHMNWLIESLEKWKRLDEKGFFLFDTSASIDSDIHQNQSRRPNDLSAENYPDMKQIEIDQLSQDQYQTTVWSQAHQAQENRLSSISYSQELYSRGTIDDTLTIKQDLSYQVVESQCLDPSPASEVAQSVFRKRKTQEENSNVSSYDSSDFDEEDFLEELERHLAGD